MNDNCLHFFLFAFRIPSQLFIMEFLTVILVAMLRHMLIRILITTLLCIRATHRILRRQ